MSVNPELPEVTIRGIRSDGAGFVLGGVAWGDMPDRLAKLCKRRSDATATARHGEVVGESYKNDDGRWIWWCEP
jgi:hypothetical protein